MAWSRRKVVSWAVAAAAVPRMAAAQGETPEPVSSWSLPIRNPDGTPGDGFVIRHGFATENTWFNPGWWHTAEDWYRDGDIETAGAEVLAVAGGEVLWIGSEYPGRVVIVEHPDGIYGMYGHLDYALDVVVGQQVTAGQVLGRVLKWTDTRAPSHLHFELRTFFLNDIVNGNAPRYAVGCGYQCPPGPGYWPMSDPQHPAEIGWRNPAHLIHAEIAASGLPDAVVVASTAAGMSIPVLAAPQQDADVVEQVTLVAGDRYSVVAMDVGDPATTETSALAYRIWYHVELPSGSTGWLQAMMADSRDTGSNGRPSSLRPILLPT